ncbi:hypothetical protein LGK95_13570 [Clostridium algoriphilum]|uniref:hypothetical protein n=1 Tax=Clostridium algoriphilum TaxID=198347 RepID=UPI001CF5BF7B|nr:hypothetical protein [Clostridium algoriphilum]MCB2294538.1 hypothetical protein [Clostridium algoriphilum]
MLRTSSYTEVVEVTTISKSTLIREMRKRGCSLYIFIILISNGYETTVSCRIIKY